MSMWRYDAAVFGVHRFYDLGSYPSRDILVHRAPKAPPLASKAPHHGDTFFGLDSIPMKPQFDYSIASFRLLPRIERKDTFPQRTLETHLTNFRISALPWQSHEKHKRGKSGFVVVLPCFKKRRTATKTRPPDYPPLSPNTHIGSPR